MNTQKTIRFSETQAAEIERTMEEDERTFGDQVKYLVKLGLEARAKIEEYRKKGMGNSHSA